MKKGGIITLSIIAIIVALIGILFGAVFCLRTQTVTILGDSAIALTKEDIVSSAGLKNGQSIFMIDKDEAINKIEATYPYVKVVQIKTTSVTEIDIRIRARHDMCYTKYNNNYYIMDEEFKVLNVIEANAEDEENNELTNLIHIEEGVLNVNSSTMICDFVGTEYQKSVMYELYTSMITTVTKTEGYGENTKEVYLSRLDVCDLLEDIQFEEYETFNKIIITTKYGVKLDIENPNEDLQNKINICFSTIKSLIEEGKDREKSGTIRIYYDLENNQKCVYIQEDIEIPQIE